MEIQFFSIKYAKILKRFLQEIIKTGIAFIKTPKNNFDELPSRDVVGQPVPSQCGFTKSTESADNEHGVIVVVVQPFREHSPLGFASREIGRHAVGMGKKP